MGHECIVCLLCQILKKAKQVHSLKIAKIQKQKDSGKQATIKALQCFLSQSDHR